jgi:hypothetical protein
MVQVARGLPVYGLLSVLVGLAALILLGAPRPLVVMVVVLFAVGVMITVINQIGS